ncbi:type IV pilus modification protein PilV [Oryzomicrobium sp.]|uniref:type IV pilus modification protein PilV n=1 Tax=Oryzomicrobium sp. TaxID=1911578 RepID=UPI0025F36D74|nr:type IV pilus modification protein PilV [Oryzomicrobium sp.]MCE1241779.1 type IV pilus modification protein PilV [Oryzomicrobium sp.]
MPLTPAPQNCRGFSLLEALVAITIFSLGLLGLVGMQAAAISSSSDAKYRADAAYLANQVISRIWTDRSNIASYQHLAAGTACAPTGTASTYTDLQNWLIDVTNTLPAGTGSVIVDTSTNTVTVRLCWQQPNSGQHIHTAIAQVN